MCFFISFEINEQQRGRELNGDNDNHDAEQQEQKQYMKL